LPRFEIFAAVRRAIAGWTPGAAFLYCSIAFFETLAQTSELLAQNIKQ
jgi:hypothetical protein